MNRAAHSGEVWNEARMTARNVVKQRVHDEPFDTEALRAVKADL